MKTTRKKSDISFTDLMNAHKDRLIVITAIALMAGFLIGTIINLVSIRSIVGTLWFSISLGATVIVFISHLLWKKAKITSISLVVIVLITYSVYIEFSTSPITVLYMFPVVTIISFYLTGRAKGLAFSFAGFVITILYLTLQKRIFGVNYHDLGALTNFILGSSFSIALIFLYEFSLVSANKKQILTNRALEELAITDSLTGLNNRKWIDNEFSLRLEKAKKGQGFSIFIIDFDDFKKINDEYGHVAGDQALKAFSKLAKTIQHVKVGRWGGEEFIFFCESASFEEAVICAEKLKQIVSENDFFPLHKITISIGVASYLDGDTMVSLMNRADKGLYKAKEQGKNTISFVDLKDADIKKK